MIEHPRAAELVAAVGAWIDSVRPQLAPRDAFLARVAANVLGVVGRELEQGPAAELAASRRLSELLGRSGDLAALEAELCALLRAGRMDAATPGLLAALRANAADRIAIDQPNYAADPG